MPKSSCVCAVCVYDVRMHAHVVSIKTEETQALHLLHTSNRYSSHGQSLDHVIYQMKGHQMLLGVTIYFSVVFVRKFS